jgi:hypothetical protein
MHSLLISDITALEDTDYEDADTSRGSQRGERSQRHGVLGLFAELVLHAGEPIQGVLSGDQRRGDNEQPGALYARA